MRRLATCKRATDSRPAFFRSAALATGFLGTLAAVPVHAEAQEKPVVDVTGNYSCNLSSNTLIPMLSSSFSVSICTTDGKTSISFQNGPTFPVTQTGGSNFSFKPSASQTSSNLASGTGYLTDDEKLVLTQEFRRQTLLGSTITLSCKYKTPCKDNLVRAVFIRPCEGDLFDTDGFTTGKTKVGGGTIESVCEDLKASGVTDVFLPFKVDDEVNSHCGKQGELLYPSEKYPANVEPKLKASGFDPIRKIMGGCGKVYGKAKIRFHAWFPVFKDRVAAQIAGLPGQKPGWAFWASDSESKLIADPTSSKVTVYQLQLLAELTQMYGVVGINLDYIRYPDSSQEAELPVGFHGFGAHTFTVDSGAITSFVETVRAKFPKLTLSADVKAGGDARTAVGQDEMLPLLDVIMPMTYSYFGMGGSDDIASWVSKVQFKYPEKLVIPDLRGWLCRIYEGCRLTETSPEFIYQLSSDIQAVRALTVGGYAIFDYESLLRDVGNDKTLKDIRRELRY